MTNQELLQKMKEDMEMRGFSHWTKESYEIWGRRNSFINKNQ